jgi:hypothetical protein
VSHFRLLLWLQHHEKDIVYYESIKREVKTKPIYECRCDERLKTKGENLHASHTMGCSEKKTTDVIRPENHGCGPSVYYHPHSFVYYESKKRKLKIKRIYECRCNGRLQTNRFTRLSHTGLVVELEHLVWGRDIFFTLLPSFNRGFLIHLSGALQYVRSVLAKFVLQCMQKVWWEGSRCDDTGSRCVKEHQISIVRPHFYPETALHYRSRTGDPHSVSSIFVERKQVMATTKFASCASRIWFR